MQVNERLAESFVSVRTNQEAIERFTDRSIGSGEATRVLRRLLRIPVVVHVVYRTKGENISKAQINSQIAVLNRDFRRTNTDATKVPDVWKGLLADANIQFVLATKNPKGKPTDGVTRTKTTRSSFGTDDSVKSSKGGGAPAWPTSKYLNIWVCTLGEGLLGYAQFPGDPPGRTGS
jgi:hypothetical protein